MAASRVGSARAVRTGSIMRISLHAGMRIYVYLFVRFVNPREGRLARHDAAGRFCARHRPAPELEPRCFQWFLCPAHALWCQRGGIGREKFCNLTEEIACHEALPRQSCAGAPSSRRGICGGIRCFVARWRGQGFLAREEPCCGQSRRRLMAFTAWHSCAVAWTACAPRFVTTPWHLRARDDHRQGVLARRELGPPTPPGGWRRNADPRKIKSDVRGTLAICATRSPLSWRTKLP